MSVPANSLKSMNRARQVIYLLVSLMVILPFVVPFLYSYRMKFTPNPEARALYDRIDSLPPGSHVLISFDYDPASQAELTPMANALLRHCFRKKLIPIAVVPLWLSGLDMAGDVVQRSVQAASEELKRDLVSGRDYVFLGFRPGGVQIMVRMAGDLQGTYPKDFYGQSTATMPALKGVTSLRDIDLAVDLAAGASVGAWIAYGSDPCKFPLGVGVTAVQAPDVYPFLNSKQIIGLLGGLRGAADYEKLLEIHEDGNRGMLSQSAAHLLIIALILYANIRAWMKKGA